MYLAFVRAMTLVSGVILRDTASASHPDQDSDSERLGPPSGARSDLREKDRSPEKNGSRGSRRERDERIMAFAGIQPS